MKDLRYLTDHYDEKIWRIQEINAPLNFIFITDIHFSLNKTDWELRRMPEANQAEWALDHIESMRYIIDRCPADFVVCGGDVVNDAHPRETLAAVGNALEGLGLPVHRVIGNHEDGVYMPAGKGWVRNPSPLTKQELHELWMQCSPTQEDYYWFDVPQGYRFVLLNTSDKPCEGNQEENYAHGHRCIVSGKQTAWLRDEALNTEKRVIIVSHAPMNQAHAKEMAAKPNDALLGGEAAWQVIHRAGNVAAMLSGHEHHDMMFYDGPILSISTNCDMMQECNPSCPVREPGTITEECFDVVSIKGDMMYLTRFGAGHDRQSNLVFSVPERKPWRTYIR